VPAPPMTCTAWLKAVVRPKLSVVWTLM